MGLGGALGEQAADAETHVIEATGGVESRPHREAEIGSHGMAMVAIGQRQQHQHPGASAAGTDPPQPLMHQDAVQPLQRRHVGHCAQRHQIQPISQDRLGDPLSGKPAVRLQARAQCRQHIEHHPNPGQALVGKAATRLVGIDDGIGRGQLRPGQVMIGDQHLDARGSRRGHPGNAGDAVVDGDDQVGGAGRGEGDDLGSQAVAVFEAVGNQEIDLAPPAGAQPEQRQRRAGGAIGIEIADHQNPLLRGQRPGEQRHRSVDPTQFGQG